MTAIHREAFLAGGGEMGALMRAHNWSSSSLGSPSCWPQPLRTAVRLMLNTGHPMYIWWGSDGACLYNDAYRQSIGPERHPGSLGRPAREVWDEIWEIIGPQIEHVMSGRGATWHENQLVPITRNGSREDVYWTYSFGPIDDETAANGVGGVLVVCTETTGQVLAGQRAAREIESFAALFEQAPIFMAMLRGPEHRIERANPAYMRLIGQRGILGRTVAEVLPDAVAQGYLELLDGVYRSGEPYTAVGAGYALQATPGRTADNRYVDFVYQPIRDGTGTVTGIFVVGSDVTERTLSDAALRQSERRLLLAQNAAGIASLELDIATGTVVGSDSFWDLWGLTPRESVHIGVLENIVVPQDQEVRSNPDTRKSGTAAPSVEYRIRRPDNGEIRWLSRHIEFTRDDSGRPLKMFGVMQDITERKQAEARQQLLTHELEHRIKNILAMVAAIASQTLRNTDLPTASASFNERLRALSNAHDVLTRTRWREASFEEVITRTLSVFPVEQIAISGPPLSIDAKMALALALTVNELGTNSQKYGALSVPQGRVDIDWTTDTVAESGAPRLVWSWRERGGPAVTPPTRRGFGTFLISRVLAADFNGIVQIDYAPDGVACVLTAPIPDASTPQ